VGESGLSFAGLLRQLRAEAKLTQEELAEAAGISPRSVSDLERGINRTAQKDTALLLAGALSLAGPVRDLFVAAARGKASAAEVLAARQRAAPRGVAAAAARPVPRGTGSFTGRGAELPRLAGALGGDARMVLVVGDAGVGKTRFAGEGMARAAAAGLVMMRGECLPLADTLPLLPVAQALRELGRLEDGRLLREGLAAAPAYARVEVGRLLPQLGPGKGSGPAGRDGGWRRERLFSAVADLLEAVAGRAAAGAGLVVEDVHWADGATLDLLTFLARAGSGDAVTVVATCRGDEAPVAARVTDWLAHVRGAAEVEEIRLGPLSRAEVAGQVAGLAGGPVPPSVVDELYARAEGNPFFTEQLVAAALASAEGGDLQLPAELPARLGGLLAARAARCAGDAEVVLAALAVAGRPLGEDQIGAVSGLGAEAVRRGLRQLAEARLLAEDTADEGHRPRHALLAEAVAAGLLPGERVMLHERTARALAGAGDLALAAEVAGHWQAAARPGEELPARVAAAQAAERLFGYAEAAAHWQRAIELRQASPGPAGAAGASLPRLYLRAIDAAVLSGDTRHAGNLAEEAYRRFADHPEQATAALICQRAGYLRGLHDPDAGFPLVERALKLFELGPPSAEHAEALVQYAQAFLMNAYGRDEDHWAALNRALEVAEAVGAAAVMPLILAKLAGRAFYRGQMQEGFATLDRARAAAEATGDSAALVEVAIHEGFYLEAMGKNAEDVMLRGLRAARRAGLSSWFRTAVLVNNAAESMWVRGRTAEAAALIDPLTTGPPRAAGWKVHLTRALLDMLRGDHAAAADRQRQIYALADRESYAELDREAAQMTAEMALWAGRPGDALKQVRRALAPYEEVPELADNCGQLLAAGLRACADLAEQARARRDHDAVRAAQDAASELGSWLKRTAGVPFTDHPMRPDILASRASWEAEQTRLAGSSDPAAWHAAAKTWESVGWPHRAGYAWWRHAQSQLDAGQPATAAAAALRAAAAAVDGHAPLLAQVHALAERARISLQAPPASPGAAPAPETPAPYGLTGRELTVLRLLAAGRTNAQIGAELYISPTTARVHVSNILRKLGVTSRVQAAAVAERAGLLRPGQP
jgi:DNA-binding CsgD family transcriptional regulator/transcriptional regulator with XRE-family HTH domain